MLLRPPHSVTDQSLLICPIYHSSLTVIPLLSTSCRSLNMMRHSERSLRCLSSASSSSSRAAHRVPGSKLFSTATTSCSSSSGSSSKLSPLRYHIVSEPLPYLTGLKLQHDIIDRRLKLKAKGTQTDDIVLLLGRSSARVPS
jgi:hypothetical protein